MTGEEGIHKNEITLVQTDSNAVYQALFDEHEIEH